MTLSHDFDVLVIGSGAAGLSLALMVADHAKVAVLSKNKILQRVFTVISRQTPYVKLKTYG